MIKSRIYTNGHLNLKKILDLNLILKRLYILGTRNLLVRIWSKRLSTDSFLAQKII